MKKIISATFMLAVLAGCSAPITKEAKHDMSKDVNCASAEGDMRTLRAEKAHVSSEIANGVSAIFPIGLVIHLIEGNEGDTFKVGTGQYNAALDKKIAQIQKQCGTK